MADRIAHNSKQAITWHQFGSFGGIMPVRAKTGTGKANGEIIGVRKATLWDGIRVAFYNKEEKATLAKARVAAIIKMVQEEKPHFDPKFPAPMQRSVDSVNGRKYVAPNPDTVFSVGIGEALLLKGEVLHKILKNGSLPVDREAGPVAQEPFERLKVQDYDPAKGGRLSKAQKAFKTLEANALSVKEAKWIYNPSNTDAPLRRELAAVTVARTGQGGGDFKWATKGNTAGAYGWVPKREQVTIVDRTKPGVQLSYLEEGRFSTIAMSAQESVPTEFPATFVEHPETYDRQGRLRVKTVEKDGRRVAAGPRTWTLQDHRTPQELKAGTARYLSPKEGSPDEYEERVVTLNETVRMPKNLILEHTNGPMAGSFTVWQVLPDQTEKLPDNATPNMRWYKTVYGADGKARAPLTINPNGTYNFDNRPIVTAKVECENPFLFLSKDGGAAVKQAIRADHGGGAVHMNKVVNRAVFDADAPPAQLRAPKGAHHAQEQSFVKETKEKLKTVKSHDMAPSYEKKYGTVLAKGQELYGKQIAALRQKKQAGTWEDTIDLPAMQAYRQSEEKLRKVMQDRNRFNALRQNEWRKPQGLQLRLGDDAMAKLRADVGPVSAYTKGHGDKKRDFKPAIYQDSNWREQILQPISKQGIGLTLQGLANQFEQSSFSLASPAYPKLVRLYNTEDPHILGDFKNVKPIHLAHAQLVTIADALKALHDEQTFWRAQLDFTLNALDAIDLDAVSFEANEEGVISPEAINVKRLYRQAMTQIANIELRLTHGSPLVQAFDTKFDLYAKHAKQSKGAILAAKMQEGDYSFERKELVAAQAISDVEVLAGQAHALVAKIEAKLAGIGANGPTPAPSQESLTADLEAVSTSDSGRGTLSPVRAAARTPIEEDIYVEHVPTQTGRTTINPIYSNEEEDPYEDLDAVREQVAARRSGANSLDEPQIYQVPRSNPYARPNQIVVVADVEPAADEFNGIVATGGAPDNVSEIDFDEELTEEPVRGKPQVLAPPLPPTHRLSTLSLADSVEDITGDGSQINSLLTQDHTGEKL